MTKNNQNQDREICECGHEKKEHNFGIVGAKYGCGHSVDDDGESYSLCPCKKFTPKSVKIKEVGK